MYNWEKWLCCGCRRGELPRLQELCINECPKLTGKLPKQLRSLKKLVIIGCELLVGSLQAPQIRGWKMSYHGKFRLKRPACGFTDLETSEIEISDISQFEELPPTNTDANNQRIIFPRLNNLYISDFEGLEFLSISVSEGDPTSLNSLEIKECPDLEYIELPALESARYKISSCKKLKLLAHTHSSLQELRLSLWEKLHLPLLGTKPESMKAEEWALLDIQVLGVIRLTLSRSVAHNVVKENTTADLMKALSGMYEKPSQTISWEAMRMAVSNSTGKEKLKYNDIRDLILAEEIRRRDAGETSGSGSALNLETRGREEVQDALLLAVDSPLDDWVLDSGALFHTTPHREIIQNYVAGDFGKVYLADGSALNVVGLGDARISLPNGSVWLLEKVRHIPDLRRNLISVGQLDDEGHAILFVGVADASIDTSLWHRRLGHMSEKGMKMLLSKGKLPELKSIDFDMCESCILGKQKMSDNGGEYIDGGFSEYCATQGIRMEKTIPGTPHTAAYLINREPSVPMEFRLPEEVWSGKEVKFSHLKVFCCVSYVHIDSDARSKLDAKSKICFFIGYGDEKFGYRSTVVSDVIEIDQKKSKFVNLDELAESTVQKGGEGDKENVNSQVDLTLQDENSSKWELAMKDEMDSLLGNQTWELTELPARLVVKGFQQKEGIDYTEIFSPVVKMSTIRLVLGMVAAENLHLEQLDVKTAFLHGDLEEDLYMIQPEGFIVQGQENLVCKLRKSLYGLKQAPRQWYNKFDNFMHRIGFKRCEVDHCCYVKSFDNSYIILLLYVDDMLIAGSNIEKINNLKKQLSKQFAMKDLGAAKQILGMRIIRDKANGTLKLSQSEYVKKVLSKFNMNEAKPVSTPLGSHFKLSKEQSPKTEEERDHMSKVPYASTIGSLMYAMVCTRPDIAHTVGVVSRFMSRLGKQHWEAVKWILRYLKGSLDTCLCFTGASLKLQGYVDADFAGDIDSRKSTTGFVFTLGGTTISWTSNLQKIVTLSTTEAEYVAATEAGKEMIWLHGFLDELGKKQEMGILHSDSQSAIFLAKNSIFHSKSKHIQTKYHFIRYLVEDKLVILEKICGSKNPTDMLTKGVTIEKLKLCAASIGLLA
ncbi:Retrovirus-related Pol polyprotein from transposon TNT 1-94 [Vitis vinifera]|uniref:Retrovirus-related Pol polyprotein from transposon TNT 1-94 n=1 Tax=Vitis vinifera TaxID=29760 RepID=A0A438J6C8_VITVI|nr:Retrovirus-related Pol polyprotein from transposon TNT 1-94 [Vitis vinifera]